MDQHSERGQIFIEALIMSFVFAALLVFFQVRANENTKKMKAFKFSHSTHYRGTK